MIFSVFLPDDNPSGNVVLRIACWCRYTYLNSVLNVLDVNSALPLRTVLWNRPQEIIQWNRSVAERGNPLCVNGQGGLIYLGYVWSLCYNVFHAPYFKVRSYMNWECSTILRARKWKTVRSPLLDSAQSTMIRLKSQSNKDKVYRIHWALCPLCWSHVFFAFLTKLSWFRTWIHNCLLGTSMADMIIWKQNYLRTFKVHREVWPFWIHKYHYRDEASTRSVRLHANISFI